MKIKLINPRAKKLSSGNSSRFRLPPWGLCAVAGATPDEFIVSIDDENMGEEINFSEDVDLVGITANTTAVSRAYEIADKFRRAGVPVIMGGFHVSAMPEEALEHADAVLIGEAEIIWSKVLSDLQNGKMQGVYKAEKLHDMVNIPWPRLDLIKQPEKYTCYQFIQTTRGCPFDCEFCSATQFWGRKYRTRPVDEVIEEIKALDRTKPIFFVDDHVGAIPKYQKELFEKLLPLRLKVWAGQVGVKTVQREGYLEMAAKTGCKLLFIGFESPNADSLKASNKSQNDPKEFKKIVSKAHSLGINIQGAFVLGLENDTPNVFKDLDNLVEDTHLDSVQFNILYPYPGTRLRKRLIEENRVTSDDWDNYMFDGVNFLPKYMSQDQLHKGYIWLLRRNTTMRTLLRRSLGKLCKFQLYNAVLAWKMNMGTRRSYKHIMRNRKLSNPICYPESNCSPASKS